MEPVAPRLQRPKIYLMGMMGCGKSTVGRALAQTLNLDFVDLDCLIEDHAHKSLQEIFTQEGERHFRRLESACLKTIAHLKGEKIVALGGGTVLREENRRLVRASGFSIYLKVAPELLAARLQTCCDRPLLKGLDAPASLVKLHELLRAREPFYAQADLTISNEGRVQDVLAVLTKALARLWKSSTSS
jgi:shikimate kinase